MSKYRALSSFIQAAIISVFVIVVIPLQTYLGNRDMFLFSLSELFVESIVAAIILFTVIFLLLILSERIFGHRVGDVFRILGLGMIICLYLETGLLSIGLPALNGTNSFHSIVVKGYDTLVWIFVFGVVIVYRRLFLKWGNWIAAGFFLLMICSIFDCKKPVESNVEKGELSKNFYPLYDIIKNVRYSKISNILIFVLDSFPAKAATVIVNRNPELKGHFIGFTEFPKNLGMHDETAYGLPGLLTGRYCTEHDDRGAFGMEIYGNGSFLMPYIKQDCPVFFSGALHEFGYTNRLRELLTTESVMLNKTGLAFLRSTSSTPYFRLIDIVYIRLVPYILKDNMLQKAINAVAKIPPPANAAIETFTYEALAGADYSDDSQTMLGLFHTVGTHPPFVLGKNGNRLNHPRMDRDGLLDVGYYKLRLLGELFDKLRKKGVYDISTIIVAADHGCEVMSENGSQGYESSILWIKPKGSLTPFSSDDAPTSNCRVASVVKDLINHDLSICDMRSMLSQDERIVRDKFHGKTMAQLGLGKIYYTDWIYGRDGQLLRKERH